MKEAVIISVVIHAIALIFIPDFIRGTNPLRGYTDRDITFLVEQVIEVKPEDTLSTPSFPKEERGDEKTGEGGVSAPQIKTEASSSQTQSVGVISPIFDPASPQDGGQTNIPKVAPKAQITPKEPREILRELEKEIAASGLSDEERLRRIETNKKYADRVWEQLQKHYFVPESARRQGMKGEVVLLLTIHRSGKLLETKVMRHSDFPLLDMAAVATAEAAAPFPDISDKVDFPALKIIVTFQYK